MEPDIAAIYIRDNFEPTDRLAVVLLNKQTGSVIQRIATAEKIAATDYQAWLRDQNNRQYEVYISMNALRYAATGRTKADIAVIRHIYLDIDDNGPSTIKALLARKDMPCPNYRIGSSPDKFQVIWKTVGFEKNQAEDMQKALAAEIGADPAATDCARVLRLPGFYNRKYATPFLVNVELLSRDTYRPKHFPVLEVRQPSTQPNEFGARVRRGWAEGPLSQSEKDWSYAKRALSRGESLETVVAAIANYRRYDKHNPKYYAELTVRKAQDALRGEQNSAQAQEPRIVPVRNV